MKPAKCVCVCARARARACVRARVRACVRVPQVAAFLQALFGGGAFDDVFGDAASLPALRRILEAVRLYK